MRYDKIDKKLFIQNRIELSKHLEKNSIAILNSNDIMPTNSDGTFKFKQNSDLFYLSGIDQEETIFLFYPDSKELR
ncbi:MAG: aminopeptidase P family protein, partial [Flavobacteriales bacterium TMED288]